MAKKLDRPGPKALVPFAVQRPGNKAEQLTVSPVTALFLKSVWGTERLRRLCDAHTSLMESIQRFTAAQLRLDNIESIVTQELQVEEQERKLTHKSLSYQIAQVDMKVELLDSEKELLKQERATAMARLKAEEREHNNKAPPPTQTNKSDSTKKDNADTHLDEGIAVAQRHFALTRAVKKMHRDVDESVIAGEFSKEEGEQIKQDMEQIIFATIGTS